MDRRRYTMTVDVEVVYVGQLQHSDAHGWRVDDDTANQLLFEALLAAEAAANQSSTVKRTARVREVEGLTSSAVVRLHFREPKLKERVKE